MTQEALAEQIEATSVTVSNWERDRTLPTVMHVLPLSKALGIEPGELLQRIAGESVVGTDAGASGRRAGILEAVQKIRRALDEIQQGVLTGKPVTSEELRRQSRRKRGGG